MNKIERMISMLFKFLSKSKKDDCCQMDIREVSSDETIKVTHHQHLGERAQTHAQNDEEQDERQCCDTEKCCAHTLRTSEKACC